MRVLVTGGAGFVGNVLVRKLLSLGLEVRIFDKFMFGVEPLFGIWENPDLEIIEGDITSISELKEAVKDVKAVFHLAAYVGYPMCKKYEKEAEAVNVGGMRNLCDLLGVDTPIIFASTGSCYGEVDGICTEETPLNPLSLYAETKAKAEEILKSRGNYVIYRFATGYGISPRMRFDLLINDFCYKAVNDRNLIVYEKDFSRTFIHVEDMASAFIHAFCNFDSMKDEVYNVGSEAMNLTKQEIAERIKKKVDFYLHYADFGTDEDKRNYVVSYEKIRSTGWSVETNFDQKLEDLIRLCQVLKIKRLYSNV